MAFIFRSIDAYSWIDLWLPVTLSRHPLVNGQPHLEGDASAALSGNFSQLLVLVKIK